MYDPDNKPEKKKQVTAPQPEPPKTVLLSQVQSEAASFRFYLLESSVTREAHGIGMKNGKPFILDRSKIDRVQGWRKDVLRKVWIELGGSEIKKEGSNGPPLSPKLP